MDLPLRLRTASAEDTRRVAATIAGGLRPGDLVSLTGELGAGKTCFVQGAAAALGVRDRVTSPSFLLRRDYRGDVPIIHLDVYRLDRLHEVFDLGYDDVADRRHITFVEWGDAMSPLLPQEHLEVELRLATANGSAAGSADGRPNGECDDDLAVAEPRLVRLHPHGQGWRRRIVALAVDLLPWREDDDGQA